MDRKSIFRVVAGYAILATAWILFSDAVLHHFWPEAASVYYIGRIKALAFVGATALILYWLLRRIRRAEADRYRAIFENHHAVMLLIDPENGDIVDANPAAADFYGWPRERLTAMRISDINTLSKAEIEAEMAGAKRQEQQMFRFRHRLASGDVRDVEVHSGPTVMRGKNFLYSIVQDVTERNRVEEKLQRQKNLYAAMSEINQAIVRLPAKQDIYRQVCRTAVERAGFLFAWIGEFEAATTSVQPIARYGEDGGYVEAISISTDAALASGRGPTGNAIRAGNVSIANDFMNDPATVPWREAAQKAGVRASGAFPIRCDGAVVAVLKVYAARPGFFDEEVVRLLEEIALDVSFALDNADRAKRDAAATAMLAASEERFRQIAENIREAFWLTDPAKNSMLYISPAYEEIWGRSRQSLYESPWSWMEAIHPEDRERVLEAARTRQARGDYAEEYRICRPDGTIRWIRDEAFPVRDAEGNVSRVAGVAEDITERKQALFALAEQEERFHALAEQTIAGIYMIDAGIITYMNPRAAEVFGYRPDEVVGRQARDFVFEEDWPKLDENVRKRLAGEVGSAQYEFRGRRKDGSQIMIGVHGTTAMISGRRIIIGVLQDVTEKLRAEETIRDYIVRLERAMLGTVDAVSKMVELRDPYTAGHERRVGELSAAIAAEMGLDEDMQRGLRIAGGVHDIGKIVVPAEILSKPGRLTKVEYEMVREHAQRGYDVLKSIDFPWPVAEVARQHHERLDGSGYPRGLKDEEIILEARILAVADVVESMASHRPYRPSIGIDKALQEIENGAGKLYDAHAVAACVKLFREQRYTLDC